MAPIPKPLKINACEANKEYALACGALNAASNDFDVRKTNKLSNVQAMDVNNINIIPDEYQGSDDAFIKVPAALTGREKKNISPSSNLHDSYIDPLSPSSSSSTSQATNDATFEPTIEMMVNDFDDEQTLNEEEALASLESQDPDDEINTLKEESEMPLEELLAKYRDMPPLPPPSHYSDATRKKTKKFSSHRQKNNQKKNLEVYFAQTSNKKCDKSLATNKITDTTIQSQLNVETFDTESSDGNNLADDEKIDNCEEKCAGTSLSLRQPLNTLSFKDRKETDCNSIIHNEISKVRRSHLLDLYPEGTFDNVVVIADDTVGNNKDIPIELLFGVEDEDEDEEIEEEEEEDYKKKVMIGTSYQATIPVGLSQYGDILPYENEDKLIWEPCQVSEREVEEYLIKIRDFKSNQQSEDEVSVTEFNTENQSKENHRTENKLDDVENHSFLANRDDVLPEAAATMDVDSQAVVKDNEQALHLLVQCGYDFKEALRRKRLNALPLNDCMSLWSEEECHKFEEGIQKYGKDFLKIRQNQVRTRTMRELVQFYYLWKKSERRDHNFANADTVDHMDIYLNEDNEYGSNPSSVLTPLGSPDGNIANSFGVARNSNFSHKNISIMTTASTMQSSTNLTSERNGSNTCLQQHQSHHKKRPDCNNQPSVNLTTITDDNSEHLSNTL